ncbi:Zinc finger protein 333 [Mizuhopecten yessoensis]|uniref:Zinc finger protein 333 n=1 Tax=Mizuhopecten yessoensis TaxID=6573 RepID=A0A210Q316_MIZYE|nr:Zinc finger protein 333 [Mizuhopecten yessoensis]
MMDSRSGAIKGRSRKLYNCSECRYSTICKSNLNKHNKRHDVISTSKEQELVCDRCGKKYTTKFGLKLHIKNKHELTFKHLCDICGKGFNQAVQYRLHCSSHTVGQDNVCPTCKAEFSVESSLKRHIRICKKRNASTTEEISDSCRHKCEQCHASFSTKDGLRSHVTGMHQEAKFQCNMCDKVYQWRSSLKAHLKCAHGYTS